MLDTYYNHRPKIKTLFHFFAERYKTAITFGVVSVSLVFNVVLNFSAVRRRIGRLSYGTGGGLCGLLHDRSSHFR